MENFYKFNDVVLELETGEQIPLSCYNRKVSRENLANRINKPKNEFIESLRRSVNTSNYYSNNERRQARSVSIDENYR